MHPRAPAGRLSRAKEAAEASSEAAVVGERFSEERLRAADRFVTQQMRGQDLPSVAVRVWAPGTGGYRFARGEANLKTGEKRRLGQPFRIASITKTFTATAVLRLVDEGKLETSDTLSEWYPGFPNAEKITVDDLLRMRSGIPDFTTEKFMKRWYDNPTADITARDSIRRSARKVKRFEEPGQETVYRNVNYVLLQQIVRKVSGEPLGDRIEEGILEPLGMEDSFYATGDRLPGTLRGYSKNPDTGEFQDKTVLNPAVPGGAGAMISTVRDLRPYSAALCEGDPSGSMNPASAPPKRGDGRRAGVRQVRAGARVPWRVVRAQRHIFGLAARCSTCPRGGDDRGGRQPPGPRRREQVHRDLPRGLQDPLPEHVDW
jgi:D-alanyl-D-alanine carboxypeptidase